jgi:ammonia channel protein AmtB
MTGIVGRLLLAMVMTRRLAFMKIMILVVAGLVRITAWSGMVVES